MRFNEIKEAVRMGKRELSRAPKKDYTIGFEFEVLSQVDESEMFSNFTQNWYNNNTNINFEYFFNNHFLVGRSDIRSIARDLDLALEPIYGWASEYDYYKTYNYRNYADGLPDDLKLEAKEINKLIKNYKSMSNNELEQTFKRIFAMHFFSIPIKYSDLDEKQKQYIDDIYENSKDNYETLTYKFKNLPRRLQFIDDLKLDKNESMDYYWDSEEKTNVYDSINNLNDLENYFTNDGEDITISDIEEILSSEYEEWRDELINSDFQDYVSSNSNSGAISEMADTLSQYVDGNINVHYSYHESDKNPKSWTVEPDSSVEGAEIVSPVFNNIDTAFSNMNKVFNMIKVYYDTDDTTGLHVNIGTFDSDEFQNLDLLKFLLIVGGENLLKDFDREYNDYTLDNLSRLYSWLSDKTMSDYENVIERLNDFIIRTSTKMELFNFTKLKKYGYIEVRGFGNTGYERKGQVIENYVRKILRALDIAMDPNAYKDTYLKYLAKAIEKANPSMFSASDNRALENYKKQYDRLINRPLKLDIDKISESIVSSYETIIDSIMLEKEYDMVGRIFYNTLSTIHTVMKNNDDGNYRKFLSQLISDKKAIISEFRTLSTKKDLSVEEKNRLELITPVANILKILVK